LIPYLIIVPFGIIFSIAIFRIKTSEDLKITSFLVLTCNIWSIGYCLGIMSTGLLPKIIFSTIGYAGSVSISLFFLILSAKLAGFERLLRKEILIILALKPVADFLMNTVNNITGLAGGNFIINQNGALEIVHAKFYGIFFWIWLGFDGLLGIISVIFLFIVLAKGYRFFRKQVTA
ncbi:MAG: hypothetical protein JW770_04530, partial [Actinobacteria bacterium]|nr:hypothetical protein [Actinomycetota bacterium]